MKHISLTKVMQFGPALKLPWTKLKAPKLTDNLKLKAPNYPREKLIQSKK